MFYLDVVHRTAYTDTRQALSIDKATKVIVQGFTGKQARFSYFTVRVHETRVARKIFGEHSGQPFSTEFFLKAVSIIAGHISQPADD